MPTNVNMSDLQSEPADTGAAPALLAQAAISGASEVDQPGLADESAVLGEQSSATPMHGMTHTREAPGKTTEEQMADSYERYQTTVKEVFTNIRNGVLVSASDSLLTVSNWLLSRITELGMLPELLISQKSAAKSLILSQA